MKRSFLIILALVLLAGVAVFAWFSKGRMSTVEGDSRNFSFKDTASVTKIFMADKDGRQAEIERGSNGWTVNGKYPCRGEAVLNLLEAVRNLEVKMPVPRQSREGVVSQMAFNAIKVEIYTKKKLVKQYYVGHEAPDGEGSFMILSNPKTGKNFGDPYICFIPGFFGYLQPRFITDENLWRDRLAMNYTPPEIRAVNVTYNSLPKDSSFTIHLLNTTTFRLADGNGKERQFDPVKMRQYLVYLQNLSYEKLITAKSIRLQDSLATAGAFCEMKIVKADGETDEFRFYRKAFRGEFNPELGVHYEYDPDRLYMNFDNRKEWAIIQYFVFGKLMISPEYFNPDSHSVKK
jgi:hypothetical protein